MLRRLEPDELQIELQNTATFETQEHQRSAPSVPRELAREDVEAVLGNRPVFVTLRKLLRAFRYAYDCNRDRWDFAVEISELRQLQVSNEDLRWLIGKQLVEHAEESDDEKTRGRRFRATVGFSLSARTCFVLSDLGLEFSQQLSGATSSPAGQECPLDLDSLGLVGQLRPVWDSTRHELSLGGKLVKKFKWRAANQEAILSAFAEEGWPPRIDDPLPPIGDIDPKRRLSDAIKCLNRHHANALIRFCGDGSGEGVLWERVEE